MARTWGELDHLEQRNGLSFLREPDPGFVWAAYRWVRGAKLEDVLDSVPGLTPGDFVRSMKQLIDLLDQIAVASRSQASSPTEASPQSGPLATGRPATRIPATRIPATRIPANEAGDTHSGDAEAGDTHPATRGRRHAAATREAGDTGPAEERPSREPAPKSRDVASTARAAIDAMRRGVVAYTTLAD